ncbi:hypothetical protein Y032_0047g1523 [Ancylostoma ceylanicum]|uniref:Uncharacterized protein n=1 Tax=Ancylostoma ceylanicum TaxID=53326 RepID=A0A016UCG5_9BILA|nr:hypothetical protein Y032_0047g1523 [Ancylostoma ceylanicum]
MLAFLFNWRSKSFLRSSSGPSYPYPRTHTTLMVVPPSRPIGPEEVTSAKKQSSRRRPPLNRSIPPIPESKSNESIMSQASRRSTEKVMFSSWMSATYDRVVRGCDYDSLAIYGCGTLSVVSSASSI